jgi:hypothetical protein
MIPEGRSDGGSKISDSDATGNPAGSFISLGGFAGPFLVMEFSATPA